MKELIEIQRELKAPKNQKNSFGGYNYRSCEDILEAVKPHLSEHGCMLILNDELFVANNILETEYIVINKNPVSIQAHRTYVRATATITNSKGVSVSAVGLARESANKTGMDPAQLTGATSSYARKYALNGLFLIDDTKDADATNTHGKGEPKPKPLSDVNLKALCEAKGREFIKKFDTAQACIDELKKSRNVTEDAAVVITDIFEGELNDYPRM